MCSVVISVVTGFTFIYNRWNVAETKWNGNSVIDGQGTRPHEQLIQMYLA